MRPNILFIFPDQMRAQATGYAGDPNAYSPQLDKFAEQSINCQNAVSGCPVCTPARASLLTGQFPHKHGLFLNDVHFEPQTPTLGEAFSAAGYDTGWIGKWHLNGRGRAAYIPPENHCGFDYWHVRECNHHYWDSFYYDDEPEKKIWSGYDAQAQTRDLQKYFWDHANSEKPFLMMLSWGPPHAPYDTAPPEFQELYNSEKVQLRPNVPAQAEQQARENLAGYYAHISALDSYFGEILQTLDETGLAENTIVVFWSDHGDMLGSQGMWKKQCPFDESVRVPLLIRLPQSFGQSHQVLDAPIATVDLMPTLLGLCDLPAPPAIQGNNFAPYLLGNSDAPREASLLSCYVPSGQWSRAKGGRAYRGVRTARYTYARTRQGPWILFDNDTDPYQLNNLIDNAEYNTLQQELEQELQRLLDEAEDEFDLPEKLIMRWGYPVDKNLTVPYKD